MTSHHLAEINIARMRGVNIDDPLMREFVDNLDRVNGLAESSPGFVWRLTDEGNDATGLNPYDDEQVIINVSVWEDLPSLEAFTFRTFHTDFLKRRKEWFKSFGKAYVALWWVPVGTTPTLEEAVARLDHLQRHGPSKYAFNFRHMHAAPESKPL